MKKMNSPIQATPVNRVASSVKQSNGVMASFIGEQCIGIGPAKVCVNIPFADKSAK
ncbi:hypothetical protein KAR91_15340 [Candidatus Pacearchaeota archaeon]|nr:hypothetical protein [Candidatus Pacearchaeota archaeon]